MSVVSDLLLAEALLVDFDGTLARIGARWEDAKAEAARRVPGGSSRDAVAADLAGDFQGWLDALEAAAPLTPLHPVLHELVAAGPWAVVTDNGEAVVRRAVATGVIPEPQAVAARVPGRPLKPSPVPLLAALDALGVRASAAVMVGDGEQDRLAAAAAGVAFVHVSELQPEEAVA